MALRDRLADLGRRAAGAAVDVLQEFAAVPAPETGLVKAESVLPQPAETDPKALFWDPFSIVEQLGYKDKPSHLTYNTLKLMVWRTPLIAAVIQTRLNQMASFCCPQADRFGTGYRVRLQDKRKAMSRAAQKRGREIERLMENTGASKNPRGRDSFETFLRKLGWDTLVLDQLCFEIVPDRRGRPAEWYAVDGSTIRLADQTKLFPDEDDTSRSRTVQIYDQTVVAEFTRDELAFCIRNPRSDIRLQGYGTSELEMMINAITAFLWGFDYNRNAFSQGSLQKGMINFKGALPEKQLRAFRRHWYQMVAGGVQNAWRTPITNSEEIQYINLQRSNQEMEYSQWLDFLIKVITSIYQLDPVEINFKYGNSGQRSMFEAANKERIIASKDKGLKPLLRFLGQCFTRYIVERIDEDFLFEFVGLDAQTPSEEADLHGKLVKISRTVNELRAEDGLDPLDGGDIILDPTYVQYVQQQQAMAQQAEMGGVEGGEGPEMEGAPGPEKAEGAGAGPPEGGRVGEDFGRLMEALGGEAAKSLRVDITI